MPFPINHFYKRILRRPIFSWLTYVFNRVDKQRIKEVGPDRACAEWLLRNGAFIRWKNSNEYLTDYNILIADDKQYFIEAVDATDSAINHTGFPHFENCKYINEIKLVECMYINNEALRLLSILKESLKKLEISNCDEVTEAGLKSLENLKNLETLKLSHLSSVRDKNLIADHLKEVLPNCKIDYK